MTSSPPRAGPGLSHLAEHAEEEGIVPAGTLYFAPDRGAVRMSPQNVEGELAEDSEVLGGIVLSGSIAILVEMNVEHPMKLVLDAPVTAGDVQKLLRRHVFRQNIVAHERLVGVLASHAPAQRDPANGRDTRKAMSFRQDGIENNRCRAGLASIVGRKFDLLGTAAHSRPRKSLRDGFGQRTVIGLDHQSVIAASFQHGGRKCARTVKRIGGDDTALQTEQFQHLQAPAVSLRPGALRWAKAMRASTAKTLTRCGNVRYFV